MKIYADIPRELVAEKLKAGQISSCSCSPELTEKDVEESVRIVAQIGMEPILKALNENPDADIIDKLLPQVKAYVANLYPEVKSGEAKIIFHLYGKNAVMEDWEPETADLPHEIGVLCEVVAPTQELASAICSNARVALLHGPYPGQLAAGGNLALPLNPPDNALGQVCRFSVYHLMDIDDPVALFPISVEEV